MQSKRMRTHIQQWPIVTSKEGKRLGPGGDYEKEKNPFLSKYTFRIIYIFSTKYIHFTIRGNRILIN